MAKKTAGDELPALYHPTKDIKATPSNLAEFHKKRFEGWLTEDQVNSKAAQDKTTARAATPTEYTPS